MISLDVKEEELASTIQELEGCVLPDLRSRLIRLTGAVLAPCVACEAAPGVVPAPQGLFCAECYSYGQEVESCASD